MPRAALVEFWRHDPDVVRQPVCERLHSLDARGMDAVVVHNQNTEIGRIGRYCGHGDAFLDYGQQGLAGRLDA